MFSSFICNLVVGENVVFLVTAAFFFIIAANENSTICVLKPIYHVHLMSL